jgi:hypothetical protein
MYTLKFSCCPSLSLSLSLTEFLCVFVISRLSLSQARGKNKIFCDTKTYETLKIILKSAEMGLVRQSCSTISYQNRNNNNNKNKSSNNNSSYTQRGAVKMAKEEEMSSAT